MTKKNLKDRFSSAELELEERNAFICESCGETTKDTSTHDRFSDAIQELEEKNAFVCKSCGGKMVPDEEHSDLDKKWAKTAEAINSDPSPSGA